MNYLSQKKDGFYAVKCQNPAKEQVRNCNRCLTTQRWVGNSQKPPIKMWISRSLKQVLDARDPGACRSPALEREADQQGFDGENIGFTRDLTGFQSIATPKKIEQS